MSAFKITIAWVLSVLTVPAAVGFVYLLRSGSVLAMGPSASGALPLQQLAGGDAQPLLRLVLGWVPAGFFAALVLRRVGQTSAGVSAAAPALVALVLLIAAGAAADALAVSEPFVGHLGTQIHRAGTWAAVIAMLVGSMSASFWPRLPRRPPVSLLK